MKIFENRGKKVGNYACKVWKSPQGQYTCTIPRKIAKAAELNKGSVISFEYIRGMGIIIRSCKDRLIVK